VISKSPPVIASALPQPAPSFKWIAISTAVPLSLVALPLQC